MKNNVISFLHLKTQFQTLIEISNLICDEINISSDEGFALVALESYEEGRGGEKIELELRV